MSDDTADKIDQIADDLDDMTTTVEELADAEPAPNTKTLERLKNGLEKASEAADDLVDDPDR